MFCKGLVKVEFGKHSVGADKTKRPRFALITRISMVSLIRVSRAVRGQKFFDHSLSNIPASKRELEIGSRQTSIF